MPYSRRHYRLTAHPPQRWADRAGRCFLGQPPSQHGFIAYCVLRLSRKSHTVPPPVRIRAVIPLEEFTVSPDAQRSPFVSCAEG